MSFIRIETTNMTFSHIKYFFFFSVLLLLNASIAFATHNRAGEITYRKIGQNRFEAKIVTYTKTSAPADRPELEFWWGDGDRDTLPRVSIEFNVGTDIQRNTYFGEHIYPGNGSYVLYFLDENRNGGVVNIGGSVNIAFYVETKLVISPVITTNNSPVLLQPPIDDGVINSVFIHNPNAFDPDGDSLSYELAPCKGSNGLPIPTYNVPAASVSFSLDPINGDLIWDSPLAIGEYNVAMIIREWRNVPGVGLLNIGYVTRDMQITIWQPIYDPPVISTLADTCVEAGTTLAFTVIATDTGGNETVTLSATGGPFNLSVSPATFNSTPTVTTTTGDFSWITDCAHVRKSPYSVVFKAEDSDPLVQLADLEQMFITIVSPSPKNPNAVPQGNGFILNWDQSVCPQAIGYKIYRRISSFGFIPSNCETGVPAYTGYSLIATVNGLTTTSFNDDNNGQGLAQAVTYCYMVTAFFADGAESYASIEFCAKLIRDLPIITNVDVNATDVSNGKIYIAWGKPTDLDFTQTPGPFRYILQRATATGTFSDIKTYNSLVDTTYNDSLLNTSANQYRYRVEFWNDTPGNVFKIGTTQIATSIFLSSSPGDEKNRLSWDLSVPWINSQFNIYRETTPGIFSQIATSTTTTYIDDSLVNGVEYCYYIESLGAYPDTGLVNPIINKSQILCSVPIDNEPPCPVTITQVANCELLTDSLSWDAPDSCNADTKEYVLYFAPAGSSDFEEVAIIPSGITEYVYTNPVSIAGCYYIVSRDSNDNESSPSASVCVETCPTYELPNVFTPDGDGVNDTYHPFLPFRDVRDVDMKIYNRWGALIFETTDPNIDWNGRKNNTGEELPEGVYFYICLVNEQRINSITSRELNGTISLYRGDKK